MPCRILLIFACSSCLLTSCSRKTLESDIQALRAQEAALNLQIKEVKQRISDSRREDFLEATSAATLRASIEEKEAIQPDLAAEARSAMEERVTQLKLRNGQMRAELQAYRKKFPAP